MQLYDKLNGPIGVLKAIDNIAGHVDEDSRVRLAALDLIIDKANAAKREIDAAVRDEVAAALAPAAEA